MGNTSQADFVRAWSVEIPLPITLPKCDPNMTMIMSPVGYHDNNRKMLTPDLFSKKLLPIKEEAQRSATCPPAVFYPELSSSTKIPQKNENDSVAMDAIDSPVAVESSAEVGNTQETVVTASTTTAVVESFNQSFNKASNNSPASVGALDSSPESAASGSEYRLEMKLDDDELEGLAGEDLLGDEIDTSDSGGKVVNDNDDLSARYISIVVWIVVVLIVCCIVSP